MILPRIPFSHGWPQTRIPLATPQLRLQEERANSSLNVKFMGVNSWNGDARDRGLQLHSR
jgi:hypothetical protein